MMQNVIWIVLGIVMVVLLISFGRRLGRGPSKSMGGGMNPMQRRQETVEETVKVNEETTDSHKTSGRGCGCC